MPYIIMNPIYAERILLNWILQDVKNFNQQFLGGSSKCTDNSDFLETEAGSSQPLRRI